MDPHHLETFAILDPSGPLPLDRPFTRSQAISWGIGDRHLRLYVLAGALANPIRGVYHSAVLEDAIPLRAACLHLVVPQDCAVTDRTAAWLLGAEQALAPNDHLVPPRVSMHRPPGYRLRNPLSTGGERSFAPGDVLDIAGLQVTSPLRTACDLGRLLRRDQAFACLDCMLALGHFSRDELVAAVERFAGYRNVRQLRSLAPDADGRSGSQEESILRRRWLDCSDLPRPEPQFLVKGPVGWYELDLADPAVRYAAEYDGAQWHGEDRVEHDRARRDWCRREDNWYFDVFRKEDLHGPAQLAEVRLRRGHALAARRFRA
jgi:hypothetical protein